VLFTLTFMDFYLDRHEPHGPITC